MILQFTLSMPGCSSWDGKWSGSSKLYAKTESFTGKKRIAKAQSIIDKGYYSYNFGDGWRAGVSVEQITGSRASQVRKKSSGFCGYDWMVDSIIDHGDIYNTDQKKELTA